MRGHVAVKLASCILCVACLASAGSTVRRMDRRGSPVDLGHPQILGALSHLTLRRFMPVLRARLEGCYERHLGSGVGIVGGLLLVRFDVVSFNRVDRVRVMRSSVRDPALRRCVVRSFYRWRVPSNCKGGPDRILLPVVFRPR
jgi:hypothetical protein